MTKDNNKNSKAYYVYEYWRPDTGACFYVGKGKGNRAWDLKMRNRHFMAVFNKLLQTGLSPDIRIILSGVDEETALNVEIDRIAFYGQNNLTNMTSGGDGLKNPSLEVRSAMSRSQKERFKKPEEMEKVYIRNKNRKVSKETKKKISNALIGRKMTAEQIENQKIAAKKRGVSQTTREAQKIAVTGRKRAPFSQETIDRMRVAAVKREEARRKAKLEQV